MVTLTDLEEALRLMRRQYSYRDSYSVATTVLVAGQALDYTVGYLELVTLPADQDPVVVYPFGTTARALRTRNWPRLGDYISGVLGPRAHCYAREVMVYVTEDTWVRFISFNTEYLILLDLGYTAREIATLGVPEAIVEVEHFVAADDKDTFYPTYGLYIAFRADLVAGMIYISAEGNVEGGE